MKKFNVYLDCHACRVNVREFPYRFCGSCRIWNKIGRVVGQQVDEIADQFDGRMLSETAPTEWEPDRYWNAMLVSRNG